MSDNSIVGFKTDIGNKKHPGGQQHILHINCIGYLFKIKIIPKDIGHAVCKHGQHDIETQHYPFGQNAGSEFSVNITTPSGRHWVLRALLLSRRRIVRVLHFPGCGHKCRSF